ncbi:UNVERIFIED_CONTAM: hypothetical protein RMT77_006662 [Armadillidium vulgare]
MTKNKASGNQSLNFDLSLPLNTSGNYSEENSIQGGEMDWTEKTKGLILGAFYYGYILTMTLGGSVGDRYSCIYPMGISIILNSSLTILTPVVARMSPSLLFILRFIIGLIDGFGIPPTYKLISKWFPKAERTMAISIVLSGTYFGVTATMILSGYLCSLEFLGGWPLVFYVLGSVGLIWSCLWFSIVYENPQDHPRIKDEELSNIMKGESQIMEKVKIPWMSILKSKQVWIISLVNFGSNWIDLVFLTLLPTYFDKILHIDINTNGNYSAIPFLTSSFFSVFLGVLSDIILKREILSTLTIRRISSFISGHLTSVGLVALAFAGSNASIIVPLVVASTTLSGASASGCYSSNADISRRFTGTIYGFTLTFALLPGFITPLVISLLLNHFEAVLAWKILFLLSSILAASTNLIYIIFFKTEIQPWDYPDQNKDKV